VISHNITSSLIFTRVICAIINKTDRRFILRKTKTILNFHKHLQITFHLFRSIMSKQIIS
jgi:hypothetical protein